MAFFTVRFWVARYQLLLSREGGRLTESPAAEPSRNAAIRSPYRASPDCAPVTQASAPDGFARNTQEALDRGAEMPAGADTMPFHACAPVDTTIRDPTTPCGVVPAGHVSGRQVARTYDKCFHDAEHN